MSASTLISELYSGRGKVYVTGVDGTFPCTDYRRFPFPDTAYDNISESAPFIEHWRNLCTPDTADAKASFFVEFHGDDNDTLDSLAVDAVDLISGPVAMTLGDATQCASDVAADVNATVPPSGPRFSARVVPDPVDPLLKATVWFSAVVPGTAPNGLPVSYLFSGSSTAEASTEVSGGSEAGDNQVRIWIDTSISASETVMGLAAREITDWMTKKGASSARVTQVAPLSSNNISIIRASNNMLVQVTGTGDLWDIVCPGIQDGDQITLFGDGIGAKTIGSPAIIVSNTVADITGASDSVTLRYSATYGGFYQTAISRDISAESIRNSGVAVPLVEGYETVTVPVSGTYQVLPGNPGPLPPNSTNKNSVKLDGTVALTGNYSIVLDTTTAIAGDSGAIYGGPSAVTLGAFTMSVTIGVQTFTIPSQTALQGGWAITWLHDGTVATGSFHPNFSASGFLQTAMYQDASVTNAKLATGIDGAKLLSGTVVEAALSAAVVAKLNAVADIGTVTLNNFNCVNGTTYFADATVGNLTGTLPNVATASYMRVTVVKTDASVNTVTVQGDADINGAVSYVLAAQYDSVSIASNGTEWFVVAAMP